MDTFERRWHLLESLLTGPKTRREIWEELQKYASDGESGLRSESCLSDDVRVLRSLGIGFRPLTAEDKQTKQAYTLALEFLPLLVTPEETNALQVAFQILKNLDFPEAQTLAETLSRIPLSAKKGIVEPNLDELLSSRHSPYDPEVITLLREGIRRSRAMQITYQAIGKTPRRYFIDKAQIVLQEGQLYLQAYCPREPGGTKFEQNREFRLDRFVKIDGQPVVEILKDGTKETSFPTFEMELWVSPYLAPYFTCTVKHKAFPQMDGALVIRTKERIALRAIRRVLSYGEQVKVLGPHFLIEEFRKTIARMAKNLADCPSEA